MRRVLFILSLLAIAAASAVAVDAMAGEPVLASLVKPKPSPAKPSPVLATQHLYLIRSTLSALNDANRSGNYSVLRDLAAPSFQAKYSAADLAVIFAEARRAQIDLAPAAYVEPIVTDAKLPDAQSLHLAGVIAAPPEHITFTLHFEAVTGHWRLHAIAVGRQPGTHVDIARKVELAKR